MKSRLWIAAAATCIFMTGCGAQAPAIPPSRAFSSGSSFTGPDSILSPEISAPSANPFTWRIERRADLYGNGREETIRLSMANAIVILETDRGNLSFEKEYTYAESIKLEIADLDDDGIRDVLIFVNAGGSGGEMNVHAAKVMKFGLSVLPLPYFGYHTNAVKLEAAYEDSYQLYVRSPQTGLHAT